MNINMRSNAFDASWLSAIGVGVVTKIDWVAVIGIALGIAAVYQRYQANREAKRANDIKERELSSKEKRGKHG